MTPNKTRLRGFTLVELLFVIVVLFIILAPRAGSKTTKERTFVTTDLNNFRQILRASALYSAENDDYLAHPTWGAGLSGPSGWAYLTSTRERPVPGSLSPFPYSCAGRDVDSRQYTNQLAFFRVGQVTQYLPDEKAAWCPKDVSTRRLPGLQPRWLGRAVKISSYCWNGTIGGYLGEPPDLKGRTYKVSEFLPTDFQMWEQDDDDPFNFNDAGQNPAKQSDVISKRHAGPSSWWTEPEWTRGLSGGAVVGKFDGSASFVRWPRIHDLLLEARAPNEFLNGPDFRTPP